MGSTEIVRQLFFTK